MNNPSFSGKILGSKLIQWLNFCAKLRKGLPSDGVTEVWLADHSWWWRLFEGEGEGEGESANKKEICLREAFSLSERDQEEFRILIGSMENAAFVYEFLIRKVFPDQIPLSWAEIKFGSDYGTDGTNHVSSFVNFSPQEKMDFASFKTTFQTQLQRDDVSQPIIMQTCDPTEVENFPEFSEPCCMAFNLKNSDEYLTRTFIEFFITPQRIEKGISNPGLKGKQNRKMSWKPIELLDIKRFNLRPLNDSERSQLSKAERNVKEAVRELTRAIELSDDLIE